MKKLLDSTLNELREVLKHNPNFYDDVQQSMLEEAFQNCNEYLNSWDENAIECEIGLQQGTYFIVKDQLLFLKGLVFAQKNYGFLSVEYEEMLKRASYLYNIHNLSDNQEKELKLLINVLETACYRRLMDEYTDCLELDYLLEYLDEVYMEEYINEDYYFDAKYKLFILEPYK